MTHWAYEDYSDWGRRLAASHEPEELREELASCEYDLGVATGAHHRAVGASHSMQANSQRRAQARNNVEGLSEKRRALRDALEIHEFHSERNALGRVGGAA